MKVRVEMVETFVDPLKVNIYIYHNLISNENTEVQTYKAPKDVHNRT